MKRIKKFFISFLAIFVMICNLNIQVFAKEEYEYFPVYSGNTSSIVEIMKYYGTDSSYGNRSKIAKLNGITNYSGTSSQNTTLVKLAKAGKLIKSIRTVNETTINNVSEKYEYYPVYSGNTSSIVEVMKYYGADSSYGNRSKIAKLNGITNYSGTSSQNTTLVKLAKAGKLIKQIVEMEDVPKKKDNEKSSYQCYNYSSCLGDENAIYVITKDSTPIRYGASSDSRVYEKLKVGTLVSVKRTIINSKGNKWYVLEKKDSSLEAYVYSGNVEKHEHAYDVVYKNKEGTLKMCSDCGYTTVSRNGKTYKENIISSLGQAALGDYYDESTFAGMVVRILAGEIPYVNVVADTRDLVYDVSHGKSLLVIGLDLASFLPFVSSFKNAKEYWWVEYLNDLDNATDFIVKVGKYDVTKKAYNTFIGIGTKVNGKAVGGSHNMDAFKKVLTQNGSWETLTKKIVKHPTIEGVYSITYRTTESKEFYKTAKTVYDSTYTDVEMLKYAFEALENAKPMKNSKTLKGFASNGLCFKADVQNGKITHFYPTLDLN